MASTKQSKGKRLGPTGKSDKRWSDVGDYRYLATQVVEQTRQPKPREHAGDASYYTRTEKSSAERNAVKVNVGDDLRTVENLAKEMDKMLTNVKSKGHTNELLQLFKSALNNFITEKQRPPSIRSSEREKSAPKRERARYEHAQRRLPHLSDGGLRKRPKSSVIPLQTAAPPSTPTARKSDSKHSRQSIGEFSVMSDRGTSVITTTTVTRTKIREPVISLIETSKTNTLHRCYGKQNVKALPPAQKHAGKSNRSNVAGQQRSASPKSSNLIKLAKPPQPTVSQQMKTIYENEQFDKPQCGSSPTEPPANATSRPADNEKHPCPKVDPIEGYEKSEACAGDVKVDANEEVMDREVLETEDSIVQRLTSFWNKKLNEDKDSDSNSSQWSQGSSSTYILTTNKKSKSGSGERSKEASSCKQGGSRVERSEANTYKCSGGDGSGDENPNQFDDRPDVIDFKTGLMDELIKVLSRGNNLDLLKCTSDDKVGDIKEDEGKFEKYEDDQIRNATSNSSTSVSGKLNEESDEADVEDEYSTEENTVAYDLDDNGNDNYEGNCDKETIEAIQTCLTRTVMMRNFNSNQCTDEEVTISEESCREYVSEDDDKDEDAEDVDEIVQDAEETQIDDHDDQTVVQRMEAVHDTVEAVNDKEKIFDTIKNVTDIINNLHKLIYTVKRIPDELKELAMDLHSLPIPDNIKQTLSMIVDNSILEKNQSTVKHDMLMTNELMKDETEMSMVPSGSSQTIEYCTREGSLLLFYMPSTLTQPILENVLNTIQLVSFPKQYNYLKTRVKPMSRSNTFIVSKQLFNNVNKAEQSRRDNENATKENENNEQQAYGTKLAMKSNSPLFRVFYGTMNQTSSFSTKASPSVLIVPYKKKTVTLIEDVTEKSDAQEGENEQMNEMSAPVGLARTVSAEFCNFSNVANAQVTKALSEGGSKHDGSTDVSANSELSTNACQNGNSPSNGRRRRFWHGNVEEDSSAIAGGSGDFAGTVIRHRTSSMSVLASGSINDSTSQPDIPVVGETDRTKALVKVPGEMDMLACNVIDEIREEHMSDIEDCVLVEHHQNIESEQMSVAALTDDYDDDSTKQMGGSEIVETQRQDKMTSTTRLGQVEKPPVQEVAVMANMLNVSPLETSETLLEPNDCTQTSVEQKPFNRDYLVFCCNTGTPKKAYKALGRKFNAKQNLDVLLNNDPVLKQELANIIDMDTLGEDEKQLIAICSMLLKRNTWLFNKTQLNMLLYNLGVIVSKLCNETWQNVRVIHRFTTKYWTKTKPLISCPHKQLIKLLYTMLISLMLCFIIQKQICGFPLPVCFPW